MPENRFTTEINFLKQALQDAVNKLTEPSIAHAMGEYCNQVMDKITNALIEHDNHLKEKELIDKAKDMKESTHD